MSAPAHVRPWHVVLLQWAANTVGVVVTIVDYLYLLPAPPEAQAEDVVRGNVVLGLGATVLSYVVVAFVVAPRTHRALGWTVRGDDPDPEECRRTLDLPWFLFRVSVLLWLVPGVVIAAINLHVSLLTSLIVLGVIVTPGTATAALSYLLTVRLLRRQTARVLEIAPPAPGDTAGIGERAVFIWLLTSGVPGLGLVEMVVFSPWTEPSLARLAVAAAAIGGMGIVVGFGANVLFAKSVGEPMCELTQDLAAIEAGDLDVHVEVNEWGEIGMLQAGLNRAVVALREREQLRDLFGRHVGTDVARRALRHGVELGGEEIEAAALFVDVIGSTAFAAARPPAEVVAALNRFFEVVVEVVDAHGGLVNKFEGDAALCIFGAPLRLDDPAGRALAAARAMGERLRERVPELDAGIGVSQGLVIAGNVGSTSRLEYTVIGDPVNEAARLTEQAKERPERVVASQRIVESAASDERSHWRLLEPLLLRGRLEPTVLAVPAGH
ncbi:MAG TPA: adenylate/guanylate cyclase domain-containing protein [Nocardioides sp.]|nr:adenylate/guanylate cyclase domain-containing protein [Nocardioides sp.]